jgi:hypothetical protein
MTDSRRTAARRIGAVALVLTISTAVATVIAQQQFVFFVSVTTADGTRVITDLRTEDVRVDEGGRAANVLRLIPVTWPVKVTVLVDNGFGTGPLLLHYRNGLKDFFNALPTGVEASLLTLSPQPRWLVRPTNDRTQLLKGAERLTPDDSAPRFIDALIEAANRIEDENRKETTYFPVIVMVSTTGPEGSMPRDRDINRMVEQFGKYPARVHVIMLGTGGTSPNQILGARQVQVGKYVADQTGGRYEAIAAPTRITSLLGEFGEMVAAAHDFQSQQYMVVAERPAGSTGPMGPLSMGLTRPGLRFSVTAQGLKP